MARAFGAEGIGLCRTEHMFFEGDRIWDIRSFILAETRADREKALKKLLPHQRKDFEGLFRAMKGLPVTVRLLDPPLHEFLPHSEADQKEMAKHLDVDLDLVKRRVTDLRESNPMLGHRGCRLSITYPELCVMQTRAIIEAACNVLKRSKVKAEPEIMIPLIGTKAEIDYLEKVVRETAEMVLERRSLKIPYKVGTMIEIPRAALTGRGSLPVPGPDRRGPTGQNGRAEGTVHPAGPQVRHLRRTRRRPRLGEVLCESGTELRELLPVPGAHRPGGRRPGVPLIGIPVPIPRPPRPRGGFFRAGFRRTFRKPLRPPPETAHTNQGPDTTPSRIPDRCRG
jgi:hypothetical protein